MSILKEFEQIFLEVINNDDFSEKDFTKSLNSFMKNKKLHQMILPFKEYKKNQQSIMKQKNNLIINQYILLIMLYSEIADQIKEYWNNQEQKYKINAIMKLFKRSVQINIDILTLLESGSYTSIPMLVRNIYENYVLSIFLFENKDEISLSYNEHKIFDLYNIFETKDKKIEDKINKLKKEYGENYSKTYGWTLNNNITNLSQIIDFIKEKDFKDFYQFSSILLHSSSYAVNTNIFSDDKYTSANSVGYFTNGYEIIIKKCIEIMKYYTLNVCEYFIADNYEYDKLTCQNAVEIVSNSIINSI